MKRMKGNVLTHFAHIVTVVITKNQKSFIDFSKI
jgi:hypothetical protein